MARRYSLNFAALPCLPAALCVLLNAHPVRADLASDTIGCSIGATVPYCTDETIRALVNMKEEAYQAASVKIDQGQLVSDERAYMGTIMSCANDLDCLKRTVAERIGTLQGLADAK